MTAKPFRREPHAGLERDQIMPHIGRRVGRYHQRTTVNVERVNHHQIIDQAEILNGQPLGVDQAPVAGNDVAIPADPVGIEARVVAIAETELGPSRHVAELVDRAGVGAGPAKRGEVGDNSIGGIHHRRVTPEDIERGVASRQVDVVVERIKSAHAVTRADFDLACSDLDCVRQEHIGACQIDFHRAPNRSVFKRSGTRLTSRKRVKQQRQASLTASVLKSLPSASNTFATMPLASRPARAYIAFGVSWSRNTSGSTIARARSMPLSSMPCSVSTCMTCEPKPPIEPSSMVSRISWSRASFRIMSTSSGFMKRASAIVVDNPCAASSSAAFSHSASLVPNESSAILLPSRTMRPFPISSGMPTSGMSMPRPSPRG